MMMTDRQWVDIAYKKLKGAFYFDKTELPLVDQIVCFERQDLDNELSEITKQLIQPDDDQWKDYISDIIDKIDVLVLPKSLEATPQSQIIYNANDLPVRMKRAQFYLDMPVSGHILSVLWILTIGARIDNRNEPDKAKMYEHSYGNRLKKELINPENGGISQTPYLFEPYFAQYESWRDKALARAEERLDTHQDALILMLDLRSFYYSVHISKAWFHKIIQDFFATEDMPRWVRRVHDFVYCVLTAYSDKVRLLNTGKRLSLGERIFLPIGFLPSNILANWFLTPFDKVIVDEINPVYYGRYVDDIIIVDKIEKNSTLREKMRRAIFDKDTLTEKSIVEWYFCRSNGEEPVFIKMKPIISEEVEDNSKKEHVDYVINNAILTGRDKEDITPDIRIQDSKVKAFYFREGSSRGLLNTFRAEIEKNSSEFRLLPNVEKLLRNNDYSEIFRLKNDDTPHKLRGITDLYVDRYSLSKFLGKYRKAGNMIRDKKESAFDRSLTSFMDQKTLIENYTLWERLLEIMVVNERYELIKTLIKKIYDAIMSYVIPEDLIHLNEDEDIAHRGLLYTLRAAICRTLALCWGPKIDAIINSISVIAQETGNKMFDADELTKQREAYCESRMINKYAMPIPLMASFDALDMDETADINLCHLEDLLRSKRFQFISENDGYRFYPYVIRPQEITYALVCNSISYGERIDDPKKQQEKTSQLYQKYNFPMLQPQGKEVPFPEVGVIQFGDPSQHCYAVNVQGNSKKKLKIAIGNARLKMEDFKKALTSRPNRSFERYEQLNKLINAALVEKVDMLVLPENYLPWEWIPEVARICANNQMALVTGIEHIVSSEVEKRIVAENESKAQRVYNITVTILPYKQGEYPFAHIVCHHKTHYSPEEKRQILGHKLAYFEGTDHELFQWRDMWFSVYCCYELASIKERSLFESLSDMTIAVEWNRDISYFGSIVESLCRDLHCYCVQVNSSDYGDSRVMSPSKTEHRDMIKTKGGKNYTILTDEVNIDSLREFQRMEYELQHEQDSFKPTPPDFNVDNVRWKQQGTLWKHLKQQEQHASSQQHDG